MKEFSPPHQNDQLFQFDVLRAVAIIGVFLVHCQYAMYPDFDFSYDGFFIDVSKIDGYSKVLSMSPFAFGWMGVTLFFVISGFLIHFITLKKGYDQFNLSYFFNRRFWRIYPPYIIVLLFFSFAQLNFAKITADPFDLISHLLLVHNYVEKYFFSIDAPLWSLAVEMQFYLLYPLFLWIRNKIGITKLLIALFVLSCLGTAYWQMYAPDSLVMGNSLIRHWVTWGLGAFLAECYLEKRRVFSRVSVSYLLLGFLFFYVSKLTMIHYSTDLIISSLLIVVCVEKYVFINRESNWLEKMFVPIGLCSYSFYLIHDPYLRQIFEVVDLFDIGSGHTLMFVLVNLVPVFLIIFAISYSSYWFIEQPSIRLGQRFIRVRKK